MPSPSPGPTNPPSSMHRRFLGRLYEAVTLLPRSVLAFGAVAVGREDAGRTLLRAGARPERDTRGPSSPGRTRLWGYAVVTVLLGALSLVPAALVVLAAARGALYGLVDRGPYDTSWGGPSRAGWPGSRTSPPPRPPVVRRWPRSTVSRVCSDGRRHPCAQNAEPAGFRRRPSYARWPERCSSSRLSGSCPRPDGSLRGIPRAPAWSVPVQGPGAGTDSDAARVRIRLRQAALTRWRRSWRLTAATGGCREL